MQQKVEIGSFLVTKLKDNATFAKYEIEASVDEVESEEDHVKLKFRFVLLSNPTNVKISIDGFTSVYGVPQEISRHLSNDEKNIPHVVNSLYHEIFPFLYITSKTMDIPCPAYKLAELSKAVQHSEMPQLERVDQIRTKSENADMPEPTKYVTGTEKTAGVETDIPEALIEEQKITTS